MAPNITPPRGMRDFLPAEKALREGVLATIRESFAAFGYREIETPVAEDLARLSSGEGGDNEKLIFRILHRGLDPQVPVLPGQAADLGLRYDLTLPLARFYATHRAELPAVFRSIQLAPVWRAERPQRGRYRQFTQCDIDVLGEPSDLAEVELITATLVTLDRVGITGTEVRINDRRVLAAMLDACGFAPAQRPGVLITVDKLDKVGVAGVADELRAQVGPDAAVDALVSLLEALGPPAGTNGDTGDFHPGTLRPANLRPGDFRPRDFEATLALLPAPAAAAAAGLVRIRDAVVAASPGARLVADPTLVRGMGYYTGPIFELSHPSFTGSIGGGGRYDGMIGRLAGIEVPGCGFSIGFERIVGLVDPERYGSGRRQVALLYDAATAVTAGALVGWQRRLIDQGASVRLVRRPRNLGRLLADLAAEGFDAYAEIDPTTPPPGDDADPDLHPTLHPPTLHPLTLHPLTLHPRTLHPRTPGAPAPPRATGQAPGPGS